MRPGLTEHEGDYLFAPFQMWAIAHRHRRMHQQYFLDLAWVDIRAAGGGDAIGLPFKEQLPKMLASVNSASHSHFLVDAPQIFLGNLEAEPRVLSGQQTDAVENIF